MLKVKGFEKEVKILLKKYSEEELLSEAIKALFKWLNRRSQKKSYEWDSFYRRLEFNPLPIPPSMNKLKKLGKTYGII